MAACVYFRSTYVDRIVMSCALGGVVLTATQKTQAQGFTVVSGKADSMTAVAEDLNQPVMSIVADSGGTTQATTARGPAPANNGAVAVTATAQYQGGDPDSVGTSVVRLDSNGFDVLRLELVAVQRAAGGLDRVIAQTGGNGGLSATLDSRDGSYVPGGGPRFDDLNDPRITFNLGDDFQARLFADVVSATQGTTFLMEADVEGCCAAGAATALMVLMPVPAGFQFDPADPNLDGNQNQQDINALDGQLASGGGAG